MVIFCIILGFFVAPLFLLIYYMVDYEDTSFDTSLMRWICVLITIVLISLPLLITNLPNIKIGQRAFISSFAEIILDSQLLTAKDKQDDNIYFLFFSILLLSIPPLVVIYFHRREFEKFDFLKPIISFFSLIATIFIFSSKIVDASAVSPMITFLYIRIALSVYPLTIATVIGEYFVKLEKLKQSKNKTLSQRKKQSLRKNNTEIKREI